MFHSLPKIWPQSNATLRQGMLWMVGFGLGLSLGLLPAMAQVLPASRSLGAPPLEELPPAQISGAPIRKQLISDVQVRSNGRTKALDVQRYIRTRKDQEFDPESVQGDVRRMVESGLFRDVKTYTKESAGGLIVIYELYERPRIGYVKYIGNRGMSDKKLTKETSLKVGDAINSFNTEEGRRKIEDLYRKNGFGKAFVEIREGLRPTDQGIVYYIDEGPIQRIDHVEVIGNNPEIASAARLKTQIDTKPGILWYFIRGKVDQEKIQNDVDKLTAYYRGLGFFRARVGREEVFDDDNKWLTLRFIVDEGPRYVVRGISIEGNTKFSNQPLLDNLKLQTGKYFNQAEMNADVSTLVDLYGSQGHVYADVQPDLRFLEEPGELDLVYRIKEGETFRVGDIAVHVGGENPHTRQSTVLTRLSLRPGDLIDTRQLRDSERRLKSSQLFATNPQEGEPPRISVRSPDLNSVGGSADGGSAPPKRRAVRGQTPDAKNFELVSGARYGFPVPTVPNRPQLAPTQPQAGPYSFAR